MAQRLFAIALAGFFLYVIYPLIFPVAMGAIFAVLFFPMLEKMEKRGLSTWLSSAALTLGIALLLLLPTSVLIYQVAKSTVEGLQSWRDVPNQVTGSWVEALLNTTAIHSVLEWFTTWFPIGMADLMNTLQDLVGSIGAWAGEWLTTLLTHLPGAAVALGVIVVSIYFFLVDGRRLVQIARKNTLFSSRQTDRLLHSLAGICRSVVLASIISGFCQATFEGVMVAATRTPSSLLVSVLVLIGSFIPVLGSAPVTIGVALQQFVLGRTAAGIALAISALVVGMMDNLIRPWFLRGSANLHPLLAFVAAFGGIETLGFVGVFIGPILAALLLTTIQVLNEPEGPAGNEAG